MNKTVKINVREGREGICSSILEERKYGLSNHIDILKFEATKWEDVWENVRLVVKKH